MAVTPDAIRQFALALPEVAEGRHEGLATFLVRGKRFATLGWPEPNAVSLSLPPEFRDLLLATVPDVLRPMPGGWGARGHVYLRLDLADEATARSAVRAAWRKAAPRTLAKAVLD